MKDQTALVIAVLAASVGYNHIHNSKEKYGELELVRVEYDAIPSQQCHVLAHLGKGPSNVLSPQDCVIHTLGDVLNVFSHLIISLGKGIPRPVGPHGCSAISVPAPRSYKLCVLPVLFSNWHSVVRTVSYTHLTLPTILLV